MADGSWKPSVLLGAGELRNVVQSLVVYLDDVKGLIRATSSERPVNPKVGWAVYETDTSRIVAWNGSAWNRVAYNSLAGRTGVHLKRASAQSFANGASSAFSWDTTTYDSDGFIAVPSTTVTVPTGLDGLYIISAVASWTTVTATRNTIFVTQSGTVRELATAINESFSTVVGLLDLVAGDTVTVSALQTSGAAKNATGDMWLHRLGA